VDEVSYEIFMLTICETYCKMIPTYQQQLTARLAEISVYYAAC